VNSQSPTTTPTAPRATFREKYIVKNTFSTSVGTGLTWQQQPPFAATTAESDAAYSRSRHSVGTLAHASSADTGEVTIKLRMLLVVSGEYAASAVMVIVGGALCTRINLELPPSTRGVPITSSAGWGST